MASNGVHAWNAIRPPDRLTELYGESIALIVPSLYEGFGLTALEAMQAGVPVLASDIPVLREVCGEAALYGPPDDPQSFAAGMDRLATQPSLREELAERGRGRVERFSWERSARAHLWHTAWRGVIARLASARLVCAYPLGH